MKKFLRFSLVALFAVLGTSNALAQDVDVIWEENFSSYAANDVPSGGTYSYVCTDGKSTTKIYAEDLAGGTSPELLIGKKQGDVAGGTFTATVPLGDRSGEISLVFKCNKNINVNVTGGTLGTNTGSGNDYVYPITISDGSEELTIEFKNNLTANARLDNIKLYQGNAKKPAGLSWGKASTEVTLGNGDNTYDRIPTLTNPYELDVDFDSSNPEVASITNEGEIEVEGVGETTITATFEGNDEYEAAKVSFVLKVVAAKTDAELAFSEEEVTITLGETFTAPTLSNPYDAPIEYSSSKTSVAEVDASTGEVTIKGAGTAKITAKVPTTDETYKGSASYTITVEEGSTQEIEVNVAQALEAADKLADNATSTDTYKVTGYIVDDPAFGRKTDGSLYGNVDFNIADEANGTTTLNIYRAKDIGNVNFTEETISSIKKGDKVVLKGKLKKYVKSGQTEALLELVDGELVSVETSNIQNLTIDADANAPMYNLKGERVDANYRGVVIKGGKKTIQK